MNVMTMMLFVSLVLVAFALLLLIYSVKQGDHEHADRISLAPLQDDDAATWPE